MLIDWFTVVAQFLNFLILIYLLKRFLYGPVIKAMEEREKKIADAMNQAEKAEEKARKRAIELAQDKQALLEAKDRLMVEAKNEVTVWRERAIKTARLEVERLNQAWMDRLTQDKQAFLQKLKVRVAGQVIRIGEKVLQDLANEGLEQQVISVFLKKLEQEKDRIQFKNISGRVLIQLGFEMNEDRSQELRAKLIEWFPKSKSVRFEVEDKLGIGIQVRAGGRKVEWNLADYLEKLEKEIIADLLTTEKEAA